MNVSSDDGCKLLLIQTKDAIIAEITSIDHLDQIRFLASENSEFK